MTTNFAYSADGQLCDVETAPTAASCTGGNVTYDSAGRTATYSGWTFGYDADGRLTSACKSPTCAGGFDKVEMAYDGEGHRTQLKETAAGGTVTTYDFRYQGDAIVEELKNGTVIRDYVVDEAGRTVKVIVPVGQTDAGTYLVVWNGHGDAISLQQIQSDGTLSRANSYTYSSWGTPTTTVETGFSDLGFRFLYVGAGDVQWDNGLSLGLTYMHARHYSPVLGRFLQPDPARASSQLYEYASNSPVTKSDPSGLCIGPVIVICIWGVSDAAVAALGLAGAWSLSFFATHRLQIALPGALTNCSWRPAWCHPTYQKPGQVPGLTWHVRTFFTHDPTWLNDLGKRGTPGGPAWCFKTTRTRAVCVGVASSWW